MKILKRIRITIGLSGVVVFVVCSALVAVPVIANGGITVGSEAIDRSSQVGSTGNTILYKGYAADGDGVIDTVELYVHVDPGWGTAYVGIFEPLGGNGYKCRSAASLGANPDVGYNKFEGLSLEVKAGDVMGYYYQYSSIDMDEIGSVYIGYTSGNKCIVDAEGTFANWVIVELSIKGTGSAAAPDLPAGVTDFSLSMTGANVTASWTNSGDAEGVRLVRSIWGQPDAFSDNFPVYEGDNVSYLDSWLELNFLKYYYSIWEYNETGWSSNYSIDNIGGEDVEMSVDLALPTGFYVLLAGLFLLFISFFLKSPLIYLAVIPCMVGVLIEPEFKDLWFQSGCALVIIWCALAFYKRMSEGGTG